MNLEPQKNNELNMAAYKDLFREEGFIEGFKKGRAEATNEYQAKFKKLLEQGKISKEVYDTLTKISK